MSSEEQENFSEPALWALIASVVTAALAGISWCVQKRCRRTHFAMNSGCCECSADSEVLRRTIREIIVEERQERESQPGQQRDSEEGKFELPSPIRLNKLSKV